MNLETIIATARRDKRKTPAKYGRQTWLTEEAHAALMDFVNKHNLGIKDAASGLILAALRKDATE